MLAAPSDPVPRVIERLVQGDVEDVARATLNLVDAANEGHPLATLFLVRAANRDLRLAGGAGVGARVRDIAAHHFPAVLTRGPAFPKLVVALLVLAGVVVYTGTAASQRLGPSDIEWGVTLLDCHARAIASGSQEPVGGGEPLCEVAVPAFATAFNVMVGWLPQLPLDQRAHLVRGLDFSTSYLRSARDDLRRRVARATLRSVPTLASFLRNETEDTRLAIERTLTRLHGTAAGRTGPEGWTRWYEGTQQALDRLREGGSP